ncbi:hypothetical protein H112_08876 [Trichophyton rubrum D6]|uniref:Uncharacterized protein n=2 Tax=Trichophyton TaxID=5550 RepID=A0A022VMZ5_TRIRU|nr:hypothetical protein H100_08897 [Trichophyton rubrum MR850]EZF36717.1 hypothetical protein H102_08858 [Trichophyton rubrum CBS 100081]EZF47309.1 hypothetical protein H103_08880 [Trichophyton rubrum CBS 288.86]EZF58047.1 hypothetical protein H104_08828 [Trichophyton rubrum CBS 289.86]EZF68553.1 hypothetical protein H105_08884 [Trichophyton soudanense CBS 452.61]EZF79265.1 hypothetical protein H110_08881 [Trichophyton rubrum MR1448]EZF89864.1 hypothetical protein H113_08947 [Trichophyton rub
MPSWAARLETPPPVGSSAWGFRGDGIYGHQNRSQPKMKGKKSHTLGPASVSSMRRGDWRPPPSAPHELQTPPQTPPFCLPVYQTSPLMDEGEGGAGVRSDRVSFHFWNSRG